MNPAPNWRVEAEGLPHETFATLNEAISDCAEKKAAGRAANVRDIGNGFLMWPAREKVCGPELAHSCERLKFSHRGIVRTGEPLHYTGAKWSTEAVVEIYDIPPGTTLNAVAQALVMAGSIEQFEANQCRSYAALTAQQLDCGIGTMPDLRETLSAANYSGPGPSDEAESSAMNPYGTPERPFAWKIKGHTEDFDDCGTAQAMLETEGAKLTIEILAGDYDSAKDAARLVEAAPDLLAALKLAMALMPLGTKPRAEWLNLAGTAIAKAEGRT